MLHDAPDAGATDATAGLAESGRIAAHGAVKLSQKCRDFILRAGEMRPILRAVLVGDGESVTAGRASEDRRC